MRKQRGTLEKLIRFWSRCNSKPVPRRKQRGRLCTFEALENRQLFAAAIVSDIAWIERDLPLATFGEREGICFSTAIAPTSDVSSSAPKLTNQPLGLIGAEIPFGPIWVSEETRFASAAISTLGMMIAGEPTGRIEDQEFSGFRQADSFDPSILLDHLSDIRGSQADLFTGSVSTGIGVSIPAGAGGLQPTIALRYSSSAHSASAGHQSTVGFGWSNTAVGFIQRDAYLDDDNRTRLTGGLVMQINGTTYTIEKKADNQYWVKEDAFAKIVTSDGSANASGFLLTTADGTKYYFGENHSALSSIPNLNTGKSTYLWQNENNSNLSNRRYVRMPLYMIEDVAGNRIKYEWEASNSKDDSTPDNLNPTGYRQNDYNYDNRLLAVRYNKDKVKVEFGYKNRSDRPENYHLNSVRNNASGQQDFYWRFYPTRALDNIRVTADGSEISKYTLTHDSGSVDTSKPESRWKAPLNLKSVQQTLAGGSTLPATTFTYNGGTSSYNSSRTYRFLEKIENGIGGKVEYTMTQPRGDRTPYHVKTRTEHDGLGNWGKSEYAGSNWMGYFASRNSDDRVEQLASAGGYRTVTLRFTDNQGTAQSSVHSFRGFVDSRVSVNDINVDDSLEVNQTTGDYFRLRNPSYDFVDINAPVDRDGFLTITVAPGVTYRARPSELVTTLFGREYYTEVYDRTESISDLDANKRRSAQWNAWEYTVDRLPWMEGVGSSTEEPYQIRLAHDTSFLVTQGESFGQAHTTYDYTYNAANNPYAQNSRVTTYEVRFPEGAPRDSGVLVNTLETTYTSQNNSAWVLNLKDTQTLRDPSGNVVSVTDYDYTNSSLPGYVTRVRSGFGDLSVTTQTQYDSYGNVEKTWDGRGNVATTTTYDTKFNAYPVSTKDAMGYTTKLYYVGVNTGSVNGQFGLMNMVVDINNQSTSYTYDGRNRVSKIVRPGDSSSSPTVSYEYVDPNGTDKTYRVITKQKDGTPSRESDGYNSTVSAYDAIGRLVQTRSEIGGGKQSVVTTVYDGLDRVRAQHLPVEETASNNFNSGRGIHAVRTAYDALGRILVVENADGTTVESSHGVILSGSERGNPVTQTWDPKGNVTYSRYNGIGQLTYTVDRVGQKLRYVYDATGAIKQITKDGASPDDSQITSFTYDQLGRKRSMTTVDGGTTEYRYDGNGNLTKMRNANGSAVMYSYDTLNRNTGESFGVNTTSIDSWNPASSTHGVKKYDSGTNGKGRLTSVETLDPSGVSYSGTGPVATTSYKYDDRGRVIEDKTVVSRGGFKGRTFTTKYENYDSADRPATVVLPDGEKLTTTFGENMKPVSLMSSVGSTRTLLVNPSDTTYDASGRILTFGHGADSRNLPLVTRSFEYYAPDEDGGALKRMQAKTWNGFSLQDQQYSYDSNGNISTIVDASSGITKNYFYDAANRLSGYTRDTGVGIPRGQSYSYDALGRMLIGPASYLTSNDSLAVGDYQYATVNGQTTNRLTSVDSRADFSYRYDASGRVTSRSFDGKFTDFFYDPEGRSSSIATLGPGVSWDRINYLRTPDGQLLIRHEDPAQGDSIDTIYLGAYQETVTWNENSGSTPAAGPVVKYYSFAGQRIAMKDSQGLQYLFNDHLGSTAITTDAGGTIKSVVENDPFGRRRSATGVSPSEYQYNGQRLESRVDVYDYGARMYDPVSGRFLQTDPLIPDATNPTDFDAYNYVRNNPVNMTDPSGSTPKWWDALTSWVSSLFAAPQPPPYTPAPISDGDSINYTWLADPETAFSAGGNINDKDSLAPVSLKLSGTGAYKSGGDASLNGSFEGKFVILNLGIISQSVKVKGAGKLEANVSKPLSVTGTLTGTVSTGTDIGIGLTGKLKYDNGLNGRDSISYEYQSVGSPYSYHAQVSFNDVYAWNMTITGKELRQIGGWSGLATYLSNDIGPGSFIYQLDANGTPQVLYHVDNGWNWVTNAFLDQPIYHHPGK